MDELMTYEEFLDKHKLRGETIEIIKTALCLILYKMYLSEQEA